MQTRHVNAIQTQTPSQCITKTQKRRKEKKKPRLATQCSINPTDIQMQETNARYATHLQLVIALFVQIGPARPALLVQVGAELADGDLGTAVGSNAVAARAH